MDEASSRRHFGEEGARLTYGSYLRLPQLLSQQVCQSTPPAHDELLFITIHQVYELWFQLVLRELAAARDALMTHQYWWARHLLRRVHVIERVLIEQVAIIETMTPQDFLKFRELLAPASGFQSIQFREIEFLSGARDATYLSRLRGATPEEEARLKRRLTEPTLWDAYLEAMKAEGLACDTEDECRQSLLTIAHDRSHHDDLWELSEALLTHDENSALWRARHVAMVERQIGTKSGTGGSTGAPYLWSRVALHFYPALWELRDRL